MTLQWETWAQNEGTGIANIWDGSQQRRLQAQYSRAPIKTTLDFLRPRR
jgi:hypothetical protein